jgi:hypothetical protein
MSKKVGDKIYVSIRVRPFTGIELTKELKSPLELQKHQISLLKKDGQKYDFIFNTIYDKDTTQEEVFEKSAKMIIDVINIIFDNQYSLY